MKLLMLGTTGRGTKELLLEAKKTRDLHDRDR